jgi:hypothetical protein
MKFRIKPADTYIWNLSELIDFLIAHQNQSIIIDNSAEGGCATTVGLYKWLDKFNFKSVTIETGNILEKHPIYNIVYARPWKWLEVANTIEPQYHNWQKKSIFGTLYGRPIWHRIGIASYLLANYPTISQVGMIADPEDPDQRQLFELTQLWYHNRDSLVEFAAIQNQLPISQSDVDAYIPIATKTTDGFVQQSKTAYIDFLIDMVGETYTSGNCFYVTEKTVRPMLLKKPFIIVGNKNYLEYLRQLGFRTFGDFWDEDYDGFEGRDRLLKILNLIDELAAKPIDSLEKMYWDMHYTLEHNYNLLINQSYNRHIKEII